MTQSDLFLSNQPGASFRAELNQIIESLATNSAGTAAPSPTFPSQWFADYTANMLRRRRKDNTAWIDVSPIDEALLKATTAEVLAGVEATKAVTPATLQAKSRTAHDCRFDYVNSTTCRLTRYGGDKITIDAQLRTIPTGGVDLTYSTSMNFSSIVYAYAMMTSGVMTLYADQNAPVIDARDGNSVHPGNPAITFVGAFWGTSPGFKQDAATIGVVSAWNRVARTAAAGGTPATGSGTYVPLLASLFFVSLGDEAVTALCTGFASNGVANAVTYTDLRYEGASVSATTAGHHAVAGFNIPIGCSFALLPVAGVRSVSAYGATNAGSSTWSIANWISVRG